jgi:hypothetical protein
MRNARADAQSLTRPVPGYACVPTSTFSRRPRTISRELATQCAESFLPAATLQARCNDNGVFTLSNSNEKEFNKSSRANIKTNDSKTRAR